MTESLERFPCAAAFLGRLGDGQSSFMAACNARIAVSETFDEDTMPPALVVWSYLEHGNPNLGEYLANLGKVSK